MSASAATSQRLTKREVEVMQLLANGHNSKTAALALWLSDETIKKHVKNVLKKLDTNSRTHAVAILWRQHLIY